MKVGFSILEVFMESILKLMMESSISPIREDLEDPRSIWYKICTIMSTIELIVCTMLKHFIFFGIFEKKIFAQIFDFNGGTIRY